jgi:hypothetical protein
VDLSRNRSTILRNELNLVDGIKVGNASVYEKEVSGLMLYAAQVEIAYVDGLEVDGEKKDGMEIRETEREGAKVKWLKVDGLKLSPIGEKEKAPSTYWARFKRTFLLHDNRVDIFGAWYHSTNTRLSAFRSAESYLGERLRSGIPTLKPYIIYVKEHYQGSKRKGRTWKIKLEITKK